jgi:hypothetical protein
MNRDVINLTRLANSLSKLASTEKPVYSTNLKLEKVYIETCLFLL